MNVKRFGNDSNWSPSTGLGDERTPVRSDQPPTPGRVALQAVCAVAGGAPGAYAAHAKYEQCDQLGLWLALWFTFGGAALGALLGSLRRSDPR